MKPPKPGTAAILSIEFYLVVAAVCAGSLLFRTHGHFVYPLDDTYISMAMAKNLAQHGVMGLTRHEFTASSSCPLWILLIAAMYRVTGVTWWGPLALGFTAGAAALAAAYRMLRRYVRNGFLMAGALSAVCILASLPVLGLSGMEHTLHIALAVLFMGAACRYLAGDNGVLGWVAGVTSIMVLVRYESLFLVAIFIGLALLRRKWMAALAVAAAAAFPVVAFGWISVLRGWQWLPNSVLLKGGMPQLSSFFGILMFLGVRSLWLLVLSPHLLGLDVLLAGLWIYRGRRGAGFWDPARLMLFFTVAAIFLHLQFASVALFFRYEAYLVALGILALAANGPEQVLREILQIGWSAPLRTGAKTILLVLVMLPMVARGTFAVMQFPIAAYNVYEQQYQMAAFLNRYYPGASVAANDVGAINYFNDLHCLDLAGLCNRDVYALKRRRAYDSQSMASLAAASGVRIAMLYPTWFDGKAGPAVPAQWKPVGEWRVTDNNNLGGDTVTFFAVDPREAAYLDRSLKEFAPKLPASVIRRECPSH